MKPKSNCSTALRQSYQQFFPAKVRRQLLDEARPGDYPRKIDPFTLALVLMEAHLGLASGLRCILDYFGARLGTPHLSTLSYALGSDLHGRVLGLMLERLEPRRYRRDELVAIDSMASSLPKTRRHNCVKMNDKTVGGGVLWAFSIDAKPGQAPFKLLRMAAGAWSDSKLVAAVKLGPYCAIYLMDRGFYSLQNIADWLEQGVRFIVRARKRCFAYEPLKQLGRPRFVRGAKALRIEFDGITRLGAPGRRGPRPCVRLVIATILPGAEDLILVSSEKNASAERLLANYHRRWQIENFHRLLKRTLGLAHLYSFRQRGLQLLVMLVLLLAVLLWMSEADDDDAPPGQALVKRLLTIIKRLRHLDGRDYVWRPNTVGKASWRHRR